jgi:alpha-tubulin suppressor-like RCC1 family protein
MGSTADVREVGQGVGFMCVRRETGRVQCTGAEGTGQIGLGMGSGRALTLMDTDVTDATELQSGRNHTCVTSTGRGVLCWGLNDFGQLGDGTRTNRFTPTAASIVPAGAHGFAIGAQHTCAILPSGAVACWGQNSFGQLGDGTTTDRFAAPAIVTGLP